MSKTIRILVLGIVGAFALSVAGTALAAYTTPKLTVSDAAPVGSVTLNYTQSENDDPTAKLHFFVPAEYTPSLARGAGTTIGTVRASGRATDLGNAVLPLTGTVQVRAANGTFTSSPGSQPTPLAAAATQCTGTANHTAFWVLILQAAGQTLELPVFVDAPAAPPRPGVSTEPFSASIQACLPPPDLPTGTPGRASFGFKLARVDFTLTGRVFASAGTGEPRWRVLATPYTPNTGRANPAGSVEAQSVVAFPRSVVLARPTMSVRNGVATLRIRGNVAAPTGAIVSLRLFRGIRATATVPAVALRRLSPSVYAGTYRVRQTTKRQVVFFKSRGSIRAGGGLTCEPTFGVSCLSATRAAVALSSNSVRVVIPARKR
jgi:hypothetical protein